jgi:4-hydroxybenzoate polyprenyltransferase
VLLLWPTLYAMWLAAGGVPDWRLLLIFTLGTFLMRSAGCAINDYADQDIDKFVKRTAQRPITSGRISGKEALAIAAVLTIVAFCLILPLNTLTKQMSVAAVILAGTYPYFKRFFAIRRPTSGLRSASASRWRLPRFRPGTAAGVAAADRERVLDAGLRYRIRHGATATMT